MADQYTDNPDLTAALNGVDTAAQTASQYQSASSVLPGELKSAINEKIDYNKGLIEAKNKSKVDYFNAPSAARLQYQDIFNPFQREALVQQATNNAYLPYANNQDALTQRMGSLTDIINAATGLFGAKVTSANNAATIAQQKYNNLFGLAGAKQTQSNWWYDQTHVKPTSGSDNLSITPTGWQYDANGNLVPVNNKQQSQPTEPKPVISPQLITQMNSSNINYRSPGGQWIWDKEVADWTPIVE